MSIYNPVDGGWPTKVTAYAGYDGKNKFLGKANSRRFYTIKEYTALVNKGDAQSLKASHQYDIAAIKLDSNNLGSKTGSVGYSNYGELAPKNTPTITVGFPVETASTGDDDENYDMYSSTGKILSVNKTQPELRYTNDTTSGQSGAPIWTTDPKSSLIGAVDDTIIGIHIGGSKALGYNQAVPLTYKYVDLVRYWSETDPLK